MKRNAITCLFPRRQSKRRSKTVISSSFRRQESRIRWNRHRYSFALQGSDMELLLTVKSLKGNLPSMEERRSQPLLKHYAPPPQIFVNIIFWCTLYTLLKQCHLCLRLPVPLKAKTKIDAFWKRVGAGQKSRFFLKSKALREFLMARSL